jgi:antitoxin ParD1/3/4
VGTALYVLDARDRQEQRQDELRADIQKGLDSGPAEPFDLEQLKRQGRELLGRRPNVNSD